MKSKYCKICGKEYKPKSNSQINCEDCRIRKCAFCGKNFEIKNGQWKKQFCSKLCGVKAHPEKTELLIKNRGNRPRNRKVSKCLLCGKKFEHWAGRKSKYCSKECWLKRNPKVLNDCLLCGKEFWSYENNNQKYCSQRCRDLHYRELKKGENSHFWKGGATKLNRIERARSAYKEWRKQVFIRDNYTCQKCGIKNGNGKSIYLHAHHIKGFADYPESRLDVNNGITLCKNCHLLQHSHKIFGE